MSIEVKISPVFSRYVNNQPTAEVKGSTVGECLNHLVKQFPGLKRALFDRKGELNRVINIYINGENAYPETLTKPVKDGDKLNIVMIITGG
jgi:molybdopterin converting factor small subunit